MMRDFFSQKDFGEREDEEIERLVRPQPKLKPPRRDRRREMVRVEDDPDLDLDKDLAKDPDMSMNYKNIGGSLARGVVSRFLAIADGTKDFDKWVKGKTFTHPKTKNKVKFKSLPDEEQNRIREEFNLDSGWGDSPKSKTPVDKDEQFFNQAGKKLQSQLDIDPKLMSEVKRHLDKLKDYPVYGKALIKDVLPSKKIPKGIETISDLSKAFEAGKNQTSPQESAEFSKWLKGKTFTHPETKGKVNFKNLPKEEQDRIRDEVSLDSSWGGSAKPKKKDPKIGPVPQGDKDDHFFSQAGKSLRDQLDNDPELLSEVTKQLDKLKDHPAYGGATLKDVLPSKKIPKGIDTIFDLSKAFEAGRSKAEEFVRTKEHQSPEFLAFADQVPTTLVDYSTGSASFLVRHGPKKGQKVPFESLPTADQEDWFSAYKKDQNYSELANQLKANKPFSDVARSALQGKSELASRLKKYQKDANDVDILKGIPELKGVALPEEVKTVADFQKVLSKMQKDSDWVQGEVKSEPAKPEPAKPPSPPKRLPPTKKEIQRAVSRLMDTLPTKIAVKYAGYHPEDIERIISVYQKTTEDLKYTGESLDKSLSGSFQYEVNPDKVPTPKKVMVDSERGPKLKDFSELSPKEQAEVYQQHKFDVVAKSLAIRHNLLRQLKSNKVPVTLARTLADFGLHGTKANRSKRLAVAMGKSTDVFSSALEDRASKIPDESKASVLELFQHDPATQVLAVSYFQGSDLNDIRNQYLTDGSIRQISEHQPPKAIYEKLKSALSELQQKNSQYPSTITDALEDPALSFKRRVLKQLGTLNPQKYTQVRELFSLDDARQYDKEYEKYKNDLAAWKKGDAPYIHIAPPKLPELPINYYSVKGLDKDQINSLEKERAQFQQKEQPVTPKQSSFSSYEFEELKMRVSSCACGNLSCTCQVPSDGTSKAAVYHGVDPQSKENNVYGPYTKWHPVHQRDLTDKDSDAIIKAAREWLKNKAVKDSTGEGVADTEYRAALDLAISDLDDGKYQGAITAKLYNELLAKLAGTKDLSGATIREASDKPKEIQSTLRKMAAKVASVDPKTAYEMLDLVDSMSSDLTVEPPGYDALRSAVLKAAAESPAAQKMLLPVVRLIKAQDEAKQIRATKSRSSK